MNEVNFRSEYLLDLLKNSTKILDLDTGINSLKVLQHEFEVEG